MKISSSTAGTTATINTLRPLAAPYLLGFSHETQAYRLGLRHTELMLCPSMASGSPSSDRVPRELPSHLPGLGLPRDHLLVLVVVGPEHGDFLLGPADRRLQTRTGFFLSWLFTGPSRPKYRPVHSSVR
ncbi:hypothetical protein M758_UG100600 [Ceratodon purpureus]|nr:hypothetical protein M758_UG100600 [Ceratodon purpureus]